MRKCLRQEDMTDTTILERATEMFQVVGNTLGSFDSGQEGRNCVGHSGLRQSWLCILNKAMRK